MRGRYRYRMRSLVPGDRRVYCPRCHGWVLELHPTRPEIYAVRGGADPFAAQRRVEGGRWRGICPTCRASIVLALPDG